MSYVLQEPRPEKVALVDEIQAALEGGESTLLVEMHGLTVAEATDLRRRLREADVHMKVFKNTLIDIATQRMGIEGLESYLKGPTAIAVSKQDPGSAMRVLREYMRQNEKVRVKGGLLKTQVLDAATAVTLADLPTYEQAVGQLAGVLLAPIRNLAATLNALIGGLAIALNQVVEQRSEQAGETSS